MSWLWGCDFGDGLTGFNGFGLYAVTFLAFATFFREMKSPQKKENFEG